MRFKSKSATAPAALVPVPLAFKAAWGDGAAILSEEIAAIFSDESLDPFERVAAAFEAIARTVIGEAIENDLADFTAGGLVGEITASIEKRGLGPGGRAPADPPGRPVSDQLVPWSLL